MNWTHYVVVALSLSLGALPVSADDAPPAGNTRKLVKRVRAELEAGNADQAAALVDAALKVSPDDLDLCMLHVECLDVVAQTALDEDDFAAAAAAYQRSAPSLDRLRAAHARLRPQIRQYVQDVTYDVACVFALNAQPDDAVKALQQLAAMGFVGVVDLEADPDLESLHARDDFRKLMMSLRDKAVASVLAELNEFEPYPFVFAADDVLGHSVSSDAWQGKLVIVDFWGTWCPPCRREIPHLMDLRRKYGERGLEVVGLSYENVEGDEGAKLVRNFVEKYSLNYPCVMGSEEMSAQVKNFQGFPTLLIIDRQGRVRLSLSGYHPQFLLEAVVEHLLAEPA